MSRNKIRVRNIKGKVVTRQIERVESRPTIWYNRECFHLEGSPKKIFLSRKDAWEEIERSCVNQDVEPYICPNCTCIHIGTRKE